MNIEKWFFNVEATDANDKKMYLNWRVKEKDLTSMFSILEDNIKDTNYNGMIYIQSQD